jgi:hypothetical protein
MGTGGIAGIVKQQGRPLTGGLIVNSIPWAHAMLTQGIGDPKAYGYHGNDPAN